MKKGQISIEFLLILALILLYISVLIIPNINIASDATKEVAGLSQARLAAEKITSTANNVALSGEFSRQTINVYVPKDATLECSFIPSTGQPENRHAEITFRYVQPQVLVDTNPLEPCMTPVSSADGVCEKTFSTVYGYDFKCMGFPVFGPMALKAEIEKKFNSSINGLEVDINAFTP